MLLTSLALLALMSSSAETEMPYFVSIGGEQVGAFSQMKTGSQGVDQSDSSPSRPDTLTVELEEGWLDRSALEYWLEAASIDSKAPVFTEPSVESRPRKTVTIGQIIGQGRRGRTRSWVLLEACPSDLKIDKLDETDHVWLSSIAFVARDIAAER